MLRRLVPLATRSASRQFLAVRALSSRGPNLSQAEQRLREEERRIHDKFWERVKVGAEPRFRSPVPPPPTTHHESWAPAAYVSPDPLDNALSFRTRFYIDATGEQPDHQRKVQLVVKVSKLGLSALERARLIAVGNRHYNRKRGELLLTCSRYAEVARSKAELRETVRGLVADAKENAEAHASTPDSELPLACRSRPWFPRDPRSYRGHPVGHRRSRMSH